MGLKRVVDTSFWTDSKVENFSPEDKYFMLFLLTNPKGTLLGIYELSIKQAAFQLGYSQESVVVLIERFEKKYGIIFYSPETNEVAIKNFLRHSVIKGGAPVRDCLVKDLKAVKNKDLIAQVFSHIKSDESLNETVKRIIDDFEAKNGNINYSFKDGNGNEYGYGNGYGVSSPDTGTYRPEGEAKKGVKTFAEDSDAYKAACYLAKAIKKNFPQLKDPEEKDLQRWAADFDKCNRIDGYDWDSIAAVLKFSQQDQFWRKNIRSGAKFREKYDRLLIDMEDSNNGKRRI